MHISLLDVVRSLLDKIKSSVNKRKCGAGKVAPHYNIAVIPQKYQVINPNNLFY